jgi:hypothetical protein
MTKLLRAKPVNVQVKQRGAFVPPRFDLFRPDVSISIAGKLAETFNLKSTGIIVNQNAASTQFLSFRYFLPGEPFRFFDASIGIDQVEIVFSNPATVSELVHEVTKIWSIVFHYLNPTVASSYCEATLHCDTDGVSTKAFLNDLVNVSSDRQELHKGFSLTSKLVNRDVVARISLDVSDSVPDGLYVTFAYVSRESIRELSSFERLFEGTLITYQSLQSLSQVELTEPT